MKASRKVAIRPSLTRTLFMTNLTQGRHMKSSWIPATDGSIEVFKHLTRRGLVNHLDPNTGERRP
jgi:hypothetical protein